MIPRIVSDIPLPYDSEISSENHYYPFGLSHTGMLGSSYGVEREVQSGTALPFVEHIGTQEYNEFGISYDPIGNIEKLRRRGLIPSGNCFDPGLIDDLTYHYGAEGRLTGVTDAAPEPFRPHGFKPAAGGTAHYQYDHNGNLMSDAHKSIQFSYNHLNLPLSISTPQGTLHFLYDATGRKWAKSGPDGARFYAGNIEYLDGKVQHIAFADGRLVAEYDENGTFQGTYRAEYFRTDHLGNTRLTFSDFNHDMVISPRISSGTPTAYETEITSENHYYPFGLSHTGPWYASVAPENRYRYNGKEWNEAWGLNMYDYGARWYMPDLGRWGQVDPMAEKYYQISSYGYCANSPLNYLDPDGMDIYRYNDKTGDFSLFEKTSDNFDQVGKFKYDKKTDTYILQTHKRTGEVKNRIDKIEKGILSDGANFMNKSNIIEVGGKRQPTEGGVEAFVVNLSEMVGKEIAGAYFSKDGSSSSTTHITIGEYRENRHDSAKGHGITLWNKTFPEEKLDNHIKGFFHTHPTTGYSNSTKLKPSPQDIKSRDMALKNNPNLQFYILTQPERYGDKFPLKIPYKHAW